MTDSQEWIEVGQVADIDPDTNMLRTSIKGQPVCLYRLDDHSIFATHDICTHSHASLSEGYLEDGIIECPMHQGCFNVRTGEATAAPCKVAVRTYPVKIDGDTIYVDGAGE